MNFSVMIKIKKDEMIRLAQIINVLGNDKLIRERVSVFVNDNSMLNAIVELSELKNAFFDIDKMLPSFIKNAWYYAPEIVLK